MQYKKTNSTKVNNKKRNNIIAIIIGLSIAAGISAWLWLPTDNENRHDENATTTSTAKTAQEDFSEGNDRTPSSGDNKNEAVVRNNNGSIENTPPKSQWTTSQSGQVTVYAPAKNSTLSSGDKLTGASELTEVSFRLIDDVTGVIAQGTLPVVKGKFSGTFSFSTSASEGRLDVFGTRNDGVEYSNVEIPIRFK